jgi:8-oxo-dGTP pyrophosphatase MutT (NUDIX family)
MSRGAGVILYRLDATGKNPEILVGTESVYLFEKDTPPVSMDGKLYTERDLQRIEEGRGAVRGECIKRAKDLSKALGKRIQFDTPQPWSVHFRVKGDKMGVPKGGRDESETILQAAQREFQEEVGFGIDGARASRESVEAMEYTFYLYPISSSERAAIEAKIASRASEHYSELFDIHFEPLTALLARPSGELNGKTAEGLRLFQEHLVRKAAASVVPANAAKASAASAAGKKGTSRRGGRRARNRTR